MGPLSDLFWVSCLEIPYFELPYSKDSALSSNASAVRPTAKRLQVYRTPIPTSDLILEDLNPVNAISGSFNDSICKCYFFVLILSLFLLINDLITKENIMEDKSGEDESDDQKASKSNKMDLDEIWAQYTDENEEKFFRKYIKGFIAHWESMPNNSRLSQSWSKLVLMCLEDKSTPKSCCCGPSLSDLPDELLAALSKFLFVGKD